MFRVWSPYPLFVVALVIIIAVCLNPKPSVIKAAEPNGGQKVTCPSLLFDSVKNGLERFLREHPDQRIVAYTPLSGNFCIVHEPVR